MKINDFFGIGAGVGGALGLMTQDSIVESPAASMSAMLVGAATGIMMEKGLVDEVLSQKKSTITSMIDIAYAERSRVITSQADGLNSQRHRDMVNVGKVALKIKNTGVEDTYNALAGTSLSKSEVIKLLAVGTALERKTAETAIDLASKSMSIHKPEALVSKSDNKIIKMSSHGQLEKYLEVSMGHSKEDAARKSRGLFEAVGNQGISVSGNNLVIGRGKVTQLIPLTKHFDDGSRFSKVGNVRSATSQFNPYSNLFNGSDIDVFGSKIGIHEAISGYDPEEALLFMKQAGQIDGKFGKKEKAAFMKLTDSLRMYVGLDAHEPMNVPAQSMISINTSNSIDVASVSIQKNLQGLSAARVRPEYERMLVNKLSEIDEAKAATLTNGLSINNAGVIRNVEAGKVFTASLMPSLERNETVTNIREYIPVAKNESSLFKGIAINQPSGHMSVQASHSSLLARMTGNDDTIEALAKALSIKWAVADDGAAVGNREMIDSFSVKSKFALEVANVNNSYLLVDDVINQQLFKDKRPQKLIDMNDEERRAIIKRVSKNIGDMHSGDVIGIDSSGAKSLIPRHYTSANLTDIVVNSKNNLSLVFEGIHTPDDIVKLFGVSSKAGVSIPKSETFSLMATVVDLENRGKISISDKGSSPVVTIPGMPGPGTPLGSYLMAVSSARTKYTLGNGNPADVDSHVSDIIQSINRAKSIGVLSDNDSTQKIESIGKMFHGGKITRGAMVEQILEEMKSPSKSGQDLFLTTAERLYDGSDSPRHSAEMSRLTKVFESTSPSEISQKDLRSAIGLTWGNEKYSFNETNILTTPNAGESLSGAGGQGTVSWLQLQQMKAAGLSQADIDALITPDLAARQDLSDVGSMSRRGDLSLNTEGLSISDSRVKAKADAAFIDELFSVAPEERAKMLRAKNIDGRRYSMQSDLSEIKSIPISLVSTNFTSGNMIDGVYNPSTVDKIRRDMIKNDILLSITTGSRRDILTEEAKRLEGLHVDFLKSSHKKMQKEAVSGRPETGLSAVARTYASVEGNNGNAMVISSQEAKRMFGSYNLDKHGFVMYGKDRHVALLTREPGQGPLSVAPYEVMVDSSIPTKNKKNFVYIPKNTTIKHAQYMDFDFDPVYLNAATTDAAQKAARKYRDTVSRNLESMVLMAQVASPKKGTSADFDSSRFWNNGEFNKKEYAMYAQAQMAKGRIRKEQAAGITKTVMQMQESVARSLGSGEGTLPGHISHMLTENLLKTSHMDTGKFESSVRTPADMLKAARDEFVKYGHEERYRASATKIINDTLSGGMNKSASDFGVSEDLWTQMKQDYKMGVDQLVDADVKFARSVGGYDVSRGADTGILATAAKVRRSDSLIDQVDAINNLGKGQSSSYGQESFIKNSPVDTPEINNRQILTSAIVDSVKKRKGIAFAGLAAVGAVTSLSSASVNELPARALPVNAQPPLQPRLDDKYPTRTYAEKSYEVRTDGSSSRSNMDRAMLDKNIFGDKMSANVNIQNKADVI